MKKHKLRWSAPFGASLLIAIIPGPCTTFDDVTPPESEASTVSCDPGLELNFYSVPAADHCNALLNGLGGDGGCCSEASFCAVDLECSTLLHCIDQCHAPDAESPDAATCLKGCDLDSGSSKLTHEAGPLTLLTACARDMHFPDACVDYLQ